VGDSPQEHANETMLAARLYGPGDMRIEPVPRPGKPGEGEVLLRVTAVGVCGSDLHTYTEGRIGDTVVRSPLILGHEFAGVVEAVGPGVDDLSPGDRVAVDPAIPCHRCEFCLEGNPNLCKSLRFVGLWPDDGALCEYMILPALNCFHLPDAVNDVEGVMLEPLGIAIHAVDLAKLQVARSVAVIGAGTIGLLIIRLAQLSGAFPILATERLPHRIEAARRYGADIVVDVRDADPVEAVMKATNDRGVDVAIEAAWADETITQAVQMAKRGGRVVLVGIPAGDDLYMPHSVARRKGLTIKLSRRMKHTYPRAIQLAETGRVDLTELVTHRFSLEQAPEAFALSAAYADGVIKAVVAIGR